jgi:hypothetical protein
MKVSLWQQILQQSEQAAAEFDLQRHSAPSYQEKAYILCDLLVPEPVLSRSIFSEVFLFLLGATLLIVQGKGSRRQVWLVETGDPK